MKRWMPWKYFATRIARAQGFLDPIALYAQLQKFSQPSEVAEPIELLRAGVVMHARGLVNSKVIQHNLDWVWPYWIERQFDPSDVSFLPPAFSITHINLTHRNWSALGIPGVDSLPIVDPRGLLTPFWDSWSIDVWLAQDTGEVLLPSRAKLAEQHMVLDPSLKIVNKTTSEPGISFSTEAEVHRIAGHDYCRLQATACSGSSGWLVFSARPYNPEGVSFINQLVMSNDKSCWRINDEHHVLFSRPADRHHASDYGAGDVFIHLLEKENQLAAECSVGMATAAALFRLNPKMPLSVHLDVPLGTSQSVEQHRARIAEDNTASYETDNTSTVIAQSPLEHVISWQTNLADKAVLTIPDSRFVQLYEAAIRTLVLCSPGEVYAGPYTYKRYWYRDAVFIAYGLMCCGLMSRVEAIISHFPKRQKRNGYFHSQEGEWDSNGLVLWLMDSYYECSDTTPDASLWEMIENAAKWIIHKRTPDDVNDPCAGLMPAGFSAEHLGPIDVYYWDDYWSVAGLRSAKRLAARAGKADQQRLFEDAEFAMGKAISRSLDRIQSALRSPAIPASPLRRMDAGAIGSLVASYPLNLYAPDDERVLGTVSYLIEHCFHNGGFFQDMIHSGTNIYLTLHVAQALLRAGDSRYLALMHTAAECASSTGHWPEAVHPHTGGGCMGDGHHAWAAAEWVAMIRSCFVREEGSRLVVGSGIPTFWLDTSTPCEFGPVPTRFGTLSLRLLALDDDKQRCSISWQADWHGPAPIIQVALPEFNPVLVEQPDCQVVVTRGEGP